MTEKVSNFSKVFGAFKLGNAEEIFWKQFCSDLVHGNSTWVSHYSFRNCSTWSVSQKDMFWEFYLAKSKLYMTQSLTINIAFLVLLMMALFSSGSSCNGVQSSCNELAVRIGLWIFISLITLIAILLLKLKRTVVLFTGDSIRQSFEKLGSTIIFVRLFVIVVRAVNVYFLHIPIYCVSGKEHGGFPFEFPLMHVTLGVTQMILFATMPFPWPWGGFFIGVEFVNQIMSVNTCRITSNIGAMNWIVVYSFVGLAAIAFISIFASSAFESGAIATYQAVLRQNMVAEEKNKFVQFLCSEVRSPLQHILTASSFVDKRLPYGVDKQKVMDIIRETQYMNQLADDLLLVTKIAEGRLSFAPTTCVVLHSLTREIMKKFGVDAREIFIETQNATVLTDIQFFSVLLGNICVLLRQTERRLQTPTTAASMAMTTNSSIKSNLVAKNIVASLRISLRDFLDDQHRLVVVSLEPTTSLSSVIHNDQTIILTTCRCLADVAGGEFVISDTKIEFSMTCSVSITVATAQVSDKSSSGKAVKTGIFAHIPRSKSSKMRPRMNAKLESISEAVEEGGARGGGEEVTEANSVFSEASSAKFNPAFVPSRSVENIRARVVSDDISLITCLVNLLECCGVLNIVVENSMHDFDTNEDMCDIFFISEIDLIFELRSLGYPDQIAVFTGSSAYLDQELIIFSDFVLEFPCVDDEQVAFAAWLATAPVKTNGAISKKFSMASLTASSSRTVNHDPSHKTRFFHIESAAIRKLLHWCARFLTFGLSSWILESENENIKQDVRYSSSSEMLSYYRKHGLMLFTSAQEESLFKWRLLKPMTSFNNYSYILEAKAFGYLILSVFWSRDNYDSQIRVVVILYCVGIVFRKQLYAAFIEPLHLNIMGVASLCCYILTIIHVATTVLMYFRMSPVRVSMPPPHTTVPWEHISATEFGIYSGRDLIEGLVTDIIGNLPWALFFPWPMVMIYSISSSVKILAVVFTVIGFSVNSFTHHIIVILAVLFCVLRNVALYNYEAIHRQDFVESRRSIFSNIYMERCVEICKRDMQSPVQFIVGSKSEFFNIMRHGVITGRVTLSHELIRNVKWCKFGQIALTDWLTRLENFSTSESKDNAASEYREVEAVSTSAKHVNNTKSSNNTTSNIVSADGNNSVNSNTVHTLHSQLPVVGFNYTAVVVEEVLMDHITAAMSMTSQSSTPLECYTAVDPYITYVKLDMDAFLNKVYLGFDEAKKHIHCAANKNSKNSSIGHEVMVRLFADPLNKSLPFQTARTMTIEILDTGEIDADRLPNFTMNREECDYTMSHMPHGSTKNRQRFRCRQLFTMPYYLTMRSYDARRFNNGCIREFNDTTSRLVSKCIAWISVLQAFENLSDNSFPRSAYQALFNNNLHSKFLFVQNSRRDKNCTDFVEQFGWECSHLNQLEDIVNYPTLEHVDCIAIDCTCQNNDFYSMDDVSLLRALGFKLVIIGIFDSSDQILPEHGRFDVNIIRSRLETSLKDILQAGAARCLSQLMQ